VRPIITFVIFASGLKYVGVSTTTLGWVLCAAVLLVAVSWTVSAPPWRNGTESSQVEAAAEATPPLETAAAPLDEPPRT